MPTVPITALSPIRATRGPAVLALGFRPFFLAAGLWATLVVPCWIADYGGWLSFRTYYGTVNWHGHEMVFGYTVAVVAGFLLTAVRNWTGLPTASGAALAGLLLLWLAGRVAPFALSEALPGWMIAAVDLAFLPALAAVLARPLLRSGQLRNLVFVPVLLALAVANLLVHLDALGYAPGWSTTGFLAGVDLVVLLITIIGGRVIPFFTERALPGAQARVWRPVEWVAIGAVVALTLLGILGISGGPTASVAVVAAAANAARLWGWSDRRLWSVPLLWILYLGYAWIVAGFALQALAALGLVMAPLALHALTAGAIGSLTLGMMARVALGHTGRPLQPPPAAVWAFALVNAAALVRVLGGAAVPDEAYVTVVTVAGCLWTIAFALFAASYAPILTQPRLDGLPG